MASSKKPAGRLSLTDQKYIAANCQILSDEEMALAIKKSPDAVRNYRITLPVMEDRVKFEDYISQLHKKHYWGQIKANLLKDEVAFFENEWAALFKQLTSHDVLHTDERAMIDLIMLEIHLNRALSSIRKNIEMINDYEEIRKQQQQKKHADRDLTVLADCNTQINSLLAANETLTKETNNMQQRKESLNKNLKTTREQRHKQLIEQERSMWIYLDSLTSVEKREQEGREIELIRMSADKFKQDAQQLHTFADGTADYIFLNAEVVEREKNEKDSAN